jgi:hypothetical protein
MTPEQFTYWLQGFVELGKGAAPTPEQWKSIQEHLATVFKKVTPPVAENASIAGNKTNAIDWQKISEDLARQAQQTPQWYPGYYPNQPWLNGSGIAPGTIIC